MATFATRSNGSAEIPVAKIVERDDRPIDHVGYTEEPLDLNGSVSNVVFNLGCRRGKVPNDAWDSDRYLWRVAQEIQAGSFTLDDFMTALKPAIEKTLTPESSMRESSWFAKAPGQRAELLDSIRSVLEPFAAEGKSDARAFKIPKLYQQKYNGMLGEVPGYRERISRLNRIKDVFYQVGERRGLNRITDGVFSYNYLPCNQHFVLQSDLSESYRRSATTHELDKQHAPPLDVLADRVMNEMACRPHLDNFPLWYVGERMLRGDFSREEWTAAWKARIAASDKISSAARAQLEQYNESMMKAFSVAAPQTFALKDVPDATVAALAKNYKSIREGEFAFIRRLQDADLGFKEPCDSANKMKRSPLQLAASEILEHPEKAKIVSVCDSGVAALQKDYNKKLEKLKDDMRITFFQSRLSFDHHDDFNAVMDKMIASNDFVEKATQQLTESSSVVARDLTQKAINEKWPSLKQVVALGDDRVTKAIFSDHADEMRKFWTEKFLLGGLDPTSAEGQKLINQHNAKLRARNSMRLLVSCLEADGRAMALSTHGDLDYSDSVGKGVAGVANHELDSLRAIIAKRKARQRAAVVKAQKADKTVTEHHYDHQTNVGTGSVSIDQSSVGLPAGRYYHAEIARFLTYTDSAGRPATFLGELAAKKSIREKCRLDQVFAHMKPKEIDEVNELLFQHMNASHVGYKYSWTSWTERLTLDEQFEALDHYVYIQNLCLPLHLNYAAKVVEHNPASMGTLSSQTRKDICAKVGTLPNPDNAALEELTQTVQSSLAASYAQASQGDTLAKLKAHDANIAKLGVQRDELMRRMSAFEKSKLDSGAQKYFTDLDHARIDEPGKLLGFFKDYQNAPSTEARKKAVLSMADRQHDSFVKFLATDPQSKDYAKARLDYLEKRQEHASAGEGWVSVWVARSEEEYVARLGNHYSGGFYSGFGHFKDRFGATAKLYNQYEEELGVLLRACKADEATIAKYVPRFTPDL